MRHVGIHGGDMRSSWLCVKCGGGQWVVARLKLTADNTKVLVP